MEQCQSRIATLVTEQEALRSDNARVSQELDAARARLAAERIQRASDGENHHNGLHSDTYRSLLEQKQQQKIEELLEAKAAAEQRSSEAEMLAEGFSEQLSSLLPELEQAKKDNATLDEKNKNFLKLVGSLKQQLHDARAGLPASASNGNAPNSETEMQLNVLRTRLAESEREKEALREHDEQSKEQIAALESEIRQKDAITGMQQRELETTKSKVRELSANVDKLVEEVQSRHDVEEELQQLRAATAGSTEEKKVLSEECQRLRDRVERAERDLTRSKTDQRSRGAGASADESQRLREKLETQLHAARQEAAVAVSEQFMQNQRCEELTQANAVLRTRIEEMQAEIARLSSRADPSFLMEKERLVTDLNSQLAAVQKELAAATSAAAKGRAAETLQARVRELEAQLKESKSLRAEVEARESEISRLQGESQGRIAALGVADKMIKQHEAKCDSLLGELRTSNNRVQELELQAREVSSQASVLQSLVKKLQDERTADQSRAEGGGNGLAVREELKRVTDERDSLRELLSEAEHERGLIPELRADLLRAVNERNSMRERLSEFDKERALSGELRADLSRLVQERNGLRQRLDEVEKERALVGDLRADLSRVTQERNNVRERLAEQEQDRALVADLRGDLSRVVQERNGLRDRLARANEDAVKATSECEHLAARASELLVDVEKASRERDRAAASVEQIREAFARYKKDAQEEYAGLQRHVAELEQRLEAATQSSVETAKRFHDERSALIGQVDTIKRVFEEHKAEMETLRHERDHDRSGVTEVTRRLERATQIANEHAATIEALRKRDQELLGERAELLRQVDAIKNAFEGHKGELNESRRDREQEKGKIAELAHRLERATHIGAEQAAAIENLRRREAELLSERASLVDQVAAVKSAFEGHKAEMNEIRQEREHDKARLADLTRRLDQTSQIGSEQAAVIDALRRREGDLLIERAGLLEQVAAIKTAFEGHKVELSEFRQEREHDKAKVADLTRKLERANIISSEQAGAIEVLRRRESELQAERTGLIDEVALIKRTFAQQQADVKASRQAEEERVAELHSVNASLSDSLKKCNAELDVLRHTVEEQGRQLDVSKEQVSKDLKLLGEARADVARLQSERDGVRSRFEQWQEEQRVAADQEQAQHRKNIALLQKSVDEERNTARERLAEELARVQKDHEAAVRRREEERDLLFGQVEAIKRAYEHHKTEDAKSKQAHERRKKNLAEASARLERDAQLIRAQAAEIDELKRQSQENVAVHNELVAEVTLIKKTFQQQQLDAKEEAEKKSRCAAELKAQNETLSVTCRKLEADVDVMRRALEQQGSRLDAARSDLLNTSESHGSELGLLKRLLAEARNDRTRVLVERDQMRERLEEQLAEHGKSIEAWQGQREELSVQVRQANARVATMQSEMARVVQERQLWMSRADTSTSSVEETVELRRQRDVYKEAVRKLQQQKPDDGKLVELQERVATLQAQLTAERNVSAGLKRSVQRERLGSRLDALDTVGKQIQDLKQVLGGDWSSISISNVSGIADAQSSVRKPQRNSGFAQPATPIGSGAARHASESDRKRAMELRAKLGSAKKE